MHAVAIVGFKNSGKSYLVRALAVFLKKNGSKIAIIKHAHRSIDIVDKDKPLYRCSKELTVVSDREISTLRKKTVSLEEIISGIGADYVLVEGFKQNKTLPRIVCYKNPKEKKELACGLEIGFVNNARLTNADIKKLAVTVQKKAFKLPGINCGKCGFKTCFGLAKEIVRGKKSPKDCAYAQASARLWIDGKPVFLNFFVDDIFTNVVRGFIKSLKCGRRAGKIKIEID